VKLRKGQWQFLVTMALTLGILVGISAFLIVDPFHVRAQNAGSTGTFTVSQRVTYTAGTSQIFNNIGQSAHYLSYCPSGGNFSGTIDIEESFNGATNWTPIAFATYVASPLTQCTVLQAGGYFQNIRSVITIVANTVTAEYNATSGPIGFNSSAIGSTGAVSPTSCNQSKTLSITNTTTSLLVGSVTSSQIRVCAFQVTGQQTATGVMDFQSSTAAAACTTPTNIWEINTIVGTPMTASLGAGLGQLFAAPTANSLCFANNSGQTVSVNISYASVFQGF
jgi:hypothetical protein